MSQHIKRIAAPKTWPILRKIRKYVIKTSPGPHTKEESIPITIAIRDLLGYARTLKEVKLLLNKKQVLVDGRVIKDPKFPVGIFDVISFPKPNEHYRVLINTHNKIVLKKITPEEAKFKIVRIKVKKLVKGGKKQYGFNDGRTIVTDNDYKTSDSLLIELPTQKVIKHIPFAKGNYAFLTSGKHVGESGIIEDVVKERITTKVVIKTKTSRFETLKKYVMMVGLEKPEITIE